MDGFAALAIGLTIIYFGSIVFGYLTFSLLGIGLLQYSNLTKADKYNAQVICLLATVIGIIGFMIYIFINQMLDPSKAEYMVNFFNTQAHSIDEEAPAFDQDRFSNQFFFILRLIFFITPLILIALSLVRHLSSKAIFLFLCLITLSVIMPLSPIIIKDGIDLTQITQLQLSLVNTNYLFAAVSTVIITTSRYLKRKYNANIPPEENSQLNIFGLLCILVGWSLINTSISTSLLFTLTCTSIMMIFASLVWKILTKITSNHAYTSHYYYGAFIGIISTSIPTLALGWPALFLIITCNCTIIFFIIKFLERNLPLNHTVKLHTILLSISIITTINLMVIRLIFAIRLNLFELLGGGAVELVTVVAIMLVAGLLSIANIFLTCKWIKK